MWSEQRLEPLHRVELMMGNVTHAASTLTRFSDFKSNACVHACSVASVTSDSLQPYGLWPARLLCPWDSPGKNTGVGCCFLLQGDLPDPGIKPASPVSPALQVVNLKHAAAELLRRNHDTDVGITVMLLGTILNLPNRQFQRPWLCLVFPG